MTPGPVRRWVEAARPRTLPASLVPVALGAVAVRPASVAVLNTLLCAVVAIALQVGTNYANDYSDGVRGTDAVRVGPFRLTASGLVTPGRVRGAAWAAFALAALAGVTLAARTSWWLVPVGVSAVAAGWLYTGGPRPYGYLGLGELFVLVYFGFVATVGTAYVQRGTFPSSAWWLALAAGSMACALLEANNLRDADGDAAVGKRTLAARLGRRRGSWLYAVAVAGTVLGLALGGAWPVAIVALLAYAPALRLAFSPRQGRELLPLLKASARAQLALGALGCVVVVVAR